MASRRVTKEKTWLAARDWDVLYPLVSDEASDRKNRLFGAACCWRIRHLLIDQRSIDAIIAAEQVADGEIDGEQLHQANSLAYSALGQLPGDCGPEFEPDQPEYWLPNSGIAMLYAADAPHHLTLSNPVACSHNVIRRSLEAIWNATPEGQREAQNQATTTYVALLRDIFGNPFRPLTLDPACRTSTVVSLARQMYESRDFSAMPILADALQDAGCDHPDILDHCRGNGPHVRGCWVVDHILSKS